jgi:hypothetical protein
MAIAVTRRGKYATASTFPLPEFFSSRLRLAQTLCCFSTGTWHDLRRTKMDEYAEMNQN